MSQRGYKARGKGGSRVRWREKGEGEGVEVEEGGEDKGVFGREEGEEDPGR